ncbi:hypothetical protein HBB16_13920 [Pseudonocardia sp. MCCB 268]|nr:hypothetical protein [Pseudonocardia cytotoxica]
MLITHAATSNAGRPSRRTDRAAEDRTERRRPPPRRRDRPRPGAAASSTRRDAAGWLRRPGRQAECRPSGFLPAQAGCRARLSGSANRGVAMTASANATEISRKFSKVPLTWLPCPAPNREDR